MDVDLDESWILYGLGAFLGAISILYFGFSLILDLSPAVKSFMLLSFSVVFLFSGELTDRSLLRYSVYSFSTVSYLGFILYTLLRFDLTEAQTLGLLAVSSAAFTGLGYLKNKDYSIDRARSKQLAAGTGAVLAATLLIDVSGPQPEYRLELQEEINFTGGETEFGTLTVENRFVLPRNTDIPSYDGCMAYNQTAVDHIYITPGEDNLIPGDTVENYSLTEEIDLREMLERHRINPEASKSMEGTYRLERGECPESPERKTVYIATDDEETSYAGIEVD